MWSAPARARTTRRRITVRRAPCWSSTATWQASTTSAAAPQGIGRALKQSGAARKPVFIGHGLTPDTRALLIDGTMDAVITQNPQGAVMNCVRIFANLRDGREPTSGVETVRSQVIFRENLP